MNKTDFTFEFGENIFSGYMGKTIERKMKDPKNRNVFLEVSELFYQLVQPVVVWRSIEIEKHTPDSVILETDMRIGNGPFAEVVAGAREIVAAICTVGKELEVKAKELIKNGKSLQGILLDGVASWAVDDLRCQFYDWAVEFFQSEREYRSSTFLSPGETEWDVKDQGTIYRFLEEEALGHDIKLTDSNVLDPFKSLSLAFGIGPDVLGHEGGSNCDLCVMKDRCRFRKLRAG